MIGRSEYGFGLSTFSPTFLLIDDILAGFGTGIWACIVETFDDTDENESISVSSQHEQHFNSDNSALL